MAKVEIYTKNNCPYCDMAKALLKKKGATYIEHNMENRDDELAALRARTGLRTVPQIFINDELIGGYSDMAALDQKGELDSKLG